jgi:signal transduction histidine kinase
MRTTANAQRGSIPEIMSIVHDLRNPLSTIHGSAELLIGCSLSEMQIRRIAQNLYDASIRINELLEECLIRYRDAEQPAGTCDLGELVRSAVDKIAVRAQSQSVRIFANVPEKLAMALDRQRIERVFVNLFVNALDVMPEGGEIQISAIPQRHSILIKVRDTGPGVAAEIRDRLFEPFATAGKVNGLGLGLAFSRRAISDAGGQIWAEASCEGACFAFSLPAMSAAPVQSLDSESGSSLQVAALSPA